MTIDWWTLAIQSVNVIVLVWLLGRFFWRPVAGMIEKRRTTAQQILGEAETKRSEAAAALGEIQLTRAGLEKEREAIVAAANASAEQARAAILAAAAKDAAALEAAARAAIEKERDEATKAWTERASRLGVEIAGRLAARLEGPAVSAAFLDWLLREIRSLPDAARSTAAQGGDPLEAVSAAAIEPAEQQRYLRLIDEAFGSRTQVSFRVDPTLIAGLELHGPHFLIDNSWRADLARILADLTHDGRA